MSLIKTMINNDIDSTLFFEYLDKHPEIEFTLSRKISDKILKNIRSTIFDNVSQNIANLLNDDIKNCPFHISKIDNEFYLSAKLNIDKSCEDKNINRKNLIDEITQLAKEIASNVITNYINEYYQKYTKVKFEEMLRESHKEILGDANKLLSNIKENLNMHIEKAIETSISTVISKISQNILTNKEG